MIIWPCDARASFLSCKLILAPNDHTVTPLHPDAAVEWSIPEHIIQHCSTNEGVTASHGYSVNYFLNPDAAVEYVEHS